MTGSHVSAVTEAIRGVALCVRCIARKTGVAPLSVITALTFIARTTKITEGVERCNVCALITDTHKLTYERPARSSSQPGSVSSDGSSNQPCA